MAEPQQPIGGQVAEILDLYSLIINRGQEAGVKEGMIFAVIGFGGDVIDPESGQSLGPKPIEKLRVKVREVYPKFSIAETYRIVSPRGGPGSLLSDLSQFPSPLSVSQAEQFLRAHEPQREHIAGEPEPRDPTPTYPTAHVEVGDTVRQLVR
jgi:hypothetical protein